MLVHNPGRRKKKKNKRQNNGGGRGLMDARSRKKRGAFLSIELKEYITRKVKKIKK
jgi:hypothetical protein